MDITTAKLTVKNLQQPSRQAAGEFIIDSGATYTVLPKSLVKELNIQPSFEKEFSLADGRVIKRKIGNALVEYQGQEVATPVILGQSGDSALLGAITLEAMGLVLDPFKRKLLPAHLVL